ncbi:hypothetical protein NEOKW01_1546 [Nematocida sp. AWRm80]|nr:hypothetical protein NEOKW01_1546 [Nematocida sp. AWRm80]
MHPEYTTLNKLMQLYNRIVSTNGNSTNDINSILNSTIGSTIITDDIYTSHLVSEVLVHKHCNGIKIELEIVLIRPTDSLYQLIVSNSSLSALVESISEVYLIRDRIDKLEKVPNAREELAFCRSIWYQDKIHLYRIIMEGNTSEYTKLSLETRIYLCKAIAGESKESSDSIYQIELYFKNYSYSQFLFPLVTLSELSNRLITLIRDSTSKDENSISDDSTSKDSDSISDSKDDDARISLKEKGNSKNRTGTENENRTSFSSSDCPGRINKEFIKIRNKKRNKIETEEEITNNSRIDSKKSIYHRTILLRYSILPVPSKSVYLCNNRYIHILNILRNNYIYMYLWSTRPIDISILDRLGIREDNILYHSEHSIRSTNTWYTTDI